MKRHCSASYCSNKFTCSRTWSMNNSSSFWFPHCCLRSLTVFSTTIVLQLSTLPVQPMTVILQTLISISLIHDNANQTLLYSSLPHRTTHIPWVESTYFTWHDTSADPNPTSPNRTWSCCRMAFCNTRLLDSPALSAIGLPSLNAIRQMRYLFLNL